jgi:hypothetical protein
LADRALSTRSIWPLKPLSHLAGVLLGKMSLDSLYGLRGGLPKLCNSFGYPDSAGIAGARRGRMDKLLFFLGSTPSAGDPARWLHGGGF